MKLRIVCESGKFWIQQYRWWAWRDVERVPDEVHDCFEVSYHTKKYTNLTLCLIVYGSLLVESRLEVICES